MNSPNHDTLRQWLDLKADGVLADREAALLDAHLGDCGDCRSELAALEELQVFLRDGRLSAHPRLLERVLGALPEVERGRSRQRAWLAAAVMLVVLVTGASLLAGMGSGAGSTGPIAGILGAVVDMVATSVLAAVGLLGASWRGVGMAVEKLISGSPGTLIALALGVLFLDVLFLRLWLGRRRSRQTAAPARGRDDV